MRPTFPRFIDLLAWRAVSVQNVVSLAIVSIASSLSPSCFYFGEEIRSDIRNKNRTTVLLTVLRYYFQKICEFISEIKQRGIYEYNRTTECMYF